MQQPKAITATKVNTARKPVALASANANKGK